MPTAVAATSLPRSAVKYWPVVSAPQQHHCEAADCEHGEREEEERTVVGEVDRTDQGAGHVHTPLRPRQPRLDEQRVLQHQRERERPECEVKTTEANAWQRDEDAERGGDGRADDDAGIEREVPPRRKLPGGERTQAGEARLAQRDLSSDADEHGDRQEDRRRARDPRPDN